MRSIIVLKFFLLFIPIIVFGRHADSSYFVENCSAPNSIVTSQQFMIDTLGSDVMLLEEEKQIIENDTISLVDDFAGEEDKKKRGEAAFLESIVEYIARDSIRFEIVNQKVYLYGQAEIEYEDIHLEADYIEIDFKANEVFATGFPDTADVMRGLPVFTEKGQSYRAKEIKYNFETEQGRSVSVITEEADGYLHGDTVKIMADETVHVGGGKYTTCDKDKPHFHIGFRRAKVMENKIVSGPAFMYVYDIPMPLLIPFGFFPNTKGQASGILIPSYGESSNRGFYLKGGGFYWGISDHIDLSFKGDIYSRGSWALSADSRYIRRYRYTGNFSLNYAVNIDGEEGLPDYSRGRDFKVIWNHNQDPKARPNSIFRANVNAGSSQYNRYNPTTDNEYLSNTFQSNISYSASWRDGRYNFSTNLRHSQNTITQQVDMTLPEVAFSVSRFYPFRKDGGGGDTRWYEDINMSYSMNARNRIETTDSLFFDSETWKNMRNGIQHSIPVSHSFNLFNHFNVSSSINYNERWYFHTIEKSWDDDYRAVDNQGDTIYGRVATDTISGFNAARDFSFSTGIGTNIYGMRGFSKGPVSAVRHVMRPNIGFSYRPDFASSFWGYYKEYDDPRYDDPVSYSVFEGGIYGVPPKGKSGAINFSLANNLEIKVRSRKDDGEKDRKVSLLDNLSITGSYDLARDSLNFSDIRISARTRLFDNFDISYSSQWTPYVVDENNRKINRFVWDERGQFLQLTNTTWNLNFTYTLSGGKRDDVSDQGMMLGDGGRDDEFSRGMDGMGDEFDDVDPTTTIETTPPGYIDYTVPWSLRFTYNFNYTSRIDQITTEADRNYTQTLAVSGDMRLTPKWRIGVATGYDFENNSLTYTSVNFYRDLHCWEMTINWIPIGFRKSYNLTIRVKSHVLQDLKYEQRREFFDFY